MTRSFPENILADLRLAISFYTIIPVDGAKPTASDASGSAQDFARAQWAAPIAGLFIGCTTAAALVILKSAGLAPTLCAGIALAASISITGALHEDGLADVADGFGGGHGKADKLTIMKDSCVGTYGALALLISFALRFTALAVLAGLDDMTTAAIALIAAHTVSRALLPLFMRSLPLARDKGLAAGVGQVPDGSALVALAIGAAALIAGGLWFALVSGTLLLLLMAGLRQLTRAQIGGYTGDVLGALQQGGETLILIIASATLA